MLTGDDWLPELIKMSDYDGNWHRYEEALYKRYLDDLGNRKVKFKGRPIGLRFVPMTNGKGYGFWHCIQEGESEEDRIPDPKRCERIAWIKAVIEHYDSPNVDYWQEKRGSKTDHLLWLNESYLIVLSERGKHPDGGPDAYLLKTTYVIEREHQKEKRRKRRDAWKKTNAAR